MREPEILQGEMVEVLADLEPNSVDSVCTDPPYGIGFMGREWDTFGPGLGAHRKLLHPRDRVLGKIVSDNPNLNGRSRSPARSPSQIEYDMATTGLRRFQAEVELWGAAMYRVLKPGAYLAMCGAPRSYHRMACGLEDAGFEIRDCLTWLYGQGFPKSLNIGNGLGTALKPGWEPIVLARKPFKGTVQGVYDTYGTGVLYIDACRLPMTPAARDLAKTQHASQRPADPDQGRWPANVLLDTDAGELLDHQTGERPSRYFYCAKPSNRERNIGCEDLPLTSAGKMTGGRAEGSAGLNSPRAGAGRRSGGRNSHPTVKPIALMRYLIRLVTPPGGTVLDPFLGSGTTACAAMLENRHCIGIERESEYVLVALARIDGQRALIESGRP